MPLQTAELTGDAFQFHWSDDGETWHLFGEIEDAEGFKISQSSQDVTRLGDRAKRKQPGLPDSGDFSLTLFHNPTMTETATDWMYDKAFLEFQISIAEVDGNTTTLATFAGSVKDLDAFGGVKNSEKVMTKISFDISGEVAYSSSDSSESSES